MAHARRFHEPGVGARTGMRVADGEMDLNAFFQAGRKALGAESVQEEEEDDDSEPGIARHSVEPRWSDVNSSMVLENSPAPSPRATLRNSYTASYMDGTHTEGLISPPRDLSSPRHSATRSVQSARSSIAQEEDVTHSSNTPQYKEGPRKSRLERSSYGADGPSSPSPVVERNMRVYTGLQAGLAARKLARMQPAGASEEEEEEKEMDKPDGDSLYPIIAEDDVGPDDESELDRETETSSLQSPESLESGSFDVDQGRHMGSDDEDASDAPDYDAAGSYEESVEETMYLRTKEDQQIASGMHLSVHETESHQTGTMALEGTSGSKKRILASNTRAAPVVERVTASKKQQVPNDGDAGLRRSSRYRYKPLEYWRGERVRYGRPSEPEGHIRGTKGKRVHTKADENVGDDTIEADSFEDHVLAAPPPVAVVKEIIRIPRPEGEGTFSGMKKRSKRQPIHGGHDQSKDTSSKRRVDDRKGEGRRIDPKAPTAHFEDGWDKDTAQSGKVLVDGALKEKHIACTSAHLRPRMAADCTFGFEKVFVVDDFMATGMLFLLVGGTKPKKNSKDNYYTFTVLEGCIRAVVHETTFIVAPQGMLFVPRGNDYLIENISQRVARISFAQCKKPIR